MHHLYAHSANEEMGAATLLKNLEKSLEEVHTLFAWDISSLLRLRKEALDHIELIERRSVPDTELIRRMKLFVNIGFFELADQSSALTTLIDSSGVNWSEYAHHFRGLWEKLFESDLYEKLEQPMDLAAQKRFLREVYQEYIAENVFLHELYEEMHSQWVDDLDAAQMMTAKVLTSWKEGENTLVIPGLYKDEDDANFGPMLLRMYFQFAADSQDRIESKSKNWDADRIAKLDVILMKMCIAEWQGFDEIPVKVSLNEYLDLSKEYSTPKSSAFINGILDKIGTNLREEGLINKVGRGMID